MKSLLKYLKPYTKESILAPAFKLIEALLDLVVPLVIAYIVNVGVKTKEHIVLHFVFLILLAAAGLAFSITAQFFAARASVGFAATLRKELFSHIQKFSFEKLDKIGTETLITRITGDIAGLQNGVNMMLRLLLRSPFIVFGSMIMAFTINPKAALIFAVSIPVLAISVLGITWITIPLYKKVQSHLDGLLLTTRENITGVRVIRAFCKEDAEVREFDVKNDILTKMNLFVGRISVLLNPATYVLINIAICILFLQGGESVNSGSIEQGDLLALYNYMAQMIVELVKLASLIITMNRAFACADRISAVLKEEPGMDYPEADCPESTENAQDDRRENRNETADKIAVRFSHVSFAFADAKEEALKDIDFCACEGETVGIIGGTGCGKSTLVNLISRFYDAAEGSVEVFGRNVRDYAQGELVKEIGVVPQKAVLFAGSIRDNLKWGNENATEEELARALEISQSAEIVEKKEGKLDETVEQGGRNFSGGQRQRLTIARALVKKPKILILDDSSSALDYATDLKLRRALKNECENMTTFIVSQRTSSIQSADVILVLDDGRIVGKGTHEELLMTCDVYREIHESQTKEEEASA
ncbi:MAG: ABC transporter ATP-binding protein [Lachnospiraceae bacterium]|nr:ABC transporter ATP-binding protein [Lachnospiraceae bacterium]